MVEKILQEVEKYFRDNFPKSRPKEVYLKHVEGVRKYALLLAKIYKADEFIIEVSALLHDVGADAGKDHADESAKISKKFLEKFDITSETLNEIIKCIERHSMGSETDTIEQQIIQDADGIIFIEDTYKSFFEKGKKTASSLEEAKKWTIDKTKGMMNKIKTEEGIKLANQYLGITLKEIEKLS